MGEAEIISAAIAIVGSVSFAVIYWQRFKKKLGQLRKLVDTLDDALYDDKVSEGEYEAIWESVKDLFGMEEKK